MIVDEKYLEKFLNDLDAKLKHLDSLVVDFAKEMKEIELTIERLRGELNLVKKDIESLQNSFSEHFNGCPFNRIEIEKIVETVTTKKFAEFPVELLKIRTSKVNIVTSILLTIIAVISLIISIYVLSFNP